MASHHTKNKGDLGLGMVISDLLCHGIGVFMPLSEHQPFDVVAVNHEGKMSRVQVKYRSLSPRGTLEVQLRSIYSDKNGHHTKRVDLAQFDCYAVYCPDNGKVYYLRNDEISANKSFALRVMPPKNSQKKRIVFASRYESIERIF